MYNDIRQVFLLYVQYVSNVSHNSLEPFYKIANLNSLKVKVVLKNVGNLTTTLPIYNA